MFVGVFAVIGAGTLLFAQAAGASVTGTIVGGNLGGKCLATENRAPAAGVQAQLRNCSTAASRQWMFPGDGTIRMQGLCLEPKNSAIASQTLVVLATCNTKAAGQRWEFGAKQSIVNSNSNLCLDDKYSGRTDGNTIWIWRCNSTNAQQWTAPKGAKLPPSVKTPEPPTSTGGGTSGNSAKPIGAAGSWKMIFNDEFSGTTVDTKKWWPNWYKNTGTTAPDSTDDRTCYNPSHVKVHDGEADLTATAGGCSGHGKTYHYTSGILQSYDKFQFKYGFAEARIWIPAGKGMWPAWWMINDNGEIDVLEAYGNNTAEFNYHGGVEHGGGKNIPGATSGWHTYAVDWEPGSVTWYYDGKNVGHVNSSKITSHKMPLILNLEIGPKDSGAAGAKVPATMKVDYVRVWQH